MPLYTGCILGESVNRLAITLLGCAFLAMALASSVRIVGQSSVFIAPSLAPTLWGSVSMQQGHRLSLARQDSRGYLVTPCRALISTPVLPRHLDDARYTRTGTYSFAPSLRERGAEGRTIGSPTAAWPIDRAGVSVIRVDHAVFLLGTVHSVMQTMPFTRNTTHTCGVPEGTVALVYR